LIVALLSHDICLLRKHTYSYFIGYDLWNGHELMICRFRHNCKPIKRCCVFPVSTSFTSPYVFKRIMFKQTKTITFSTITNKTTFVYEWIEKIKNKVHIFSTKNKTCIMLYSPFRASHDRRSAETCYINPI